MVLSLSLSLASSTIGSRERLSSKRAKLPRTSASSEFICMVGTWTIPYYLIPKYIWYGSIVPTLEISMYMYNVHT